jgi:mannan endo-1,4-beta-mannosidase
VQIAPGKYDERGLKSLDFVLETARKYGLQVVLSFIDNWKYYNGVDQYLDWSNTAPNRTMDSPFKDLQGDPTGAIYGSGEAGEELKRSVAPGSGLICGGGFEGVSSRLVLASGAGLVARHISSCVSSAAWQQLFLVAVQETRAVPVAECLALCSWCCRYEVERHALFFTDAGARKIYKDHVAFLVNRNNTING